MFTTFHHNKISSTCQHTDSLIVKIGKKRKRKVGSVIQCEQTEATMKEKKRRGERGAAQLFRRYIKVYQCWLNEISKRSQFRISNGVPLRGVRSDSDDNKAGYRQRDIITNQVGCTLTLGAVVDFRYAIKPQSHYMRPRNVRIHVSNRKYAVRIRSSFFSLRIEKNASVRFQLLLNKNQD